MTRIALFVLLLSACKIRNEQSCDIPGNCVDTDGGGQACNDNDDCDTGVCKLSDGICVGCLETSDCEASSNTPICNEATNMCEGCRVNADCPSEACDVDFGACFAAEQVAYVQLNGTGDCEQSMPCGTLLEAVTTARPVIKIRGTGTLSGPTAVITRKVLVMGDRGPTLPIVRAMASGSTFVVQNAELSVRDIEISDNPNGDGISVMDSGGKVTLDHVFLLRNGKIGVNASTGNRLVMRGSVVAKNAAGGITLTDMAFEITNTIIASNGNTTNAQLGGMRTLSTDAPSTCIFEFNTVADNLIANGSADKAGVECGSAFPARNNIVSGVAASAALGTACRFDHSLFTGAVPTGDGNMMAPDVLAIGYVDVANEAQDDYYRISPTSLATDQATTSAIVIDIDGQPRPQGAEKDLGADEVMR